MSQAEKKSIDLRFALPCSLTIFKTFLDGQARRPGFGHNLGGSIEKVFKFETRIPITTGTKEFIAQELKVRKNLIVSWIEQSSFIESFEVEV